MNSFPSSKRIKEEFVKFSKCPLHNLGITVGLFEKDNIYRWRVTFLGPSDTSYNRGLFFVEVIIPKLYPEEAPKIIFKTPIYHPNVNMEKSSNNLELGQVAFKAINEWKNSYNIKDALTRLYTIFYYPNLDLVCSLEIAKEYKENLDLFEKKAKYFTKKYAAPTNIGIKEYKYWDFSCNGNDLNSMKIKQNEDIINKVDYDGNQIITLILEINGFIETKIKCKLNELIKDVIKKVLDQNGIYEKNNILVICGSKKIKLDVPIGEYHPLNYFRITIILDE